MNRGPSGGPGADDASPELDEEISRAAGLIAAGGAGGLVVLTGAGMSTDAGIPDFRGPQGVWTRDPSAERLSTLSAYLDDPDVRRRSWQMRLSSPVWEAQPTAGHAALVDLERAGLLSGIVTQNTDGLHLLAGHQPERVVEIHGTVHWTQCWSCEDRQPTLTTLQRVRDGDPDPHCLRPVPVGDGDGDAVCGGIVKTATVSFGQALDAAVLDAALDLASKARVLLAVGSSLEVKPAADLVPLAQRRGASIVIVNGSPTALDHLADVVVRGSISDVLPRLAASARK
jgi:NAD-dependent deacetylase